MRILITGKPRSGKTTLIKRIIPFLRQPCGFFTEEISKGNKRIGFKIKTLDGEEALLAKQGFPSKVKVSKYGVDLKSLERIVELVKREAEDKEFIVIDEIGKMEWTSFLFREFIFSILESKKKVIATISEKANKEISKIKEREDVVLFKINRDNFEDIYKKVFSLKDSLSKTELKDLDNKAKNILGIPENILIENASRSIKEVLLEEKFFPKKVIIFAGRGNNSADSLALARHLLNEGVDIEIVLILNNKPCNKQVEFQLNILRKIMDKRKIKIVNRENDLKSLELIFKSKDLVIDGIFGIGFSPPLDNFYKELFRIINVNSKKTLAVDVPSGLDADKGDVDKIAIKAEITVTFVSPKIGFYIKEGPFYTGKIFVKDIGVSKDVLEKLE